MTREQYERLMQCCDKIIREIESVKYSLKFAYTHYRAPKEQHILYSAAEEAQRIIRLNGGDTDAQKE